MKRVSALLLALIVSATSPAFGQSSSPLELTSSTTTLDTGKTATIEITASVNEALIGIDTVLSYDAEKIEVVSITPTTLFDQYGGIESATTVPGIIRFSGINDTPKAAVGSLATITIKAIAPGSAPIDFIFDPKDTTSSGIIPAEGDVDNLLTEKPLGITLDITGKALVPTTKTSGSSPIRTTQKDSSNLLTTVLLILLTVVIGCVIAFLFIKNKRKLADRIPKSYPVNPTPTSPKPLATSPEPPITAGSDLYAAKAPVTPPQPIGVQPTTFPEPATTQQNFPPTGTPPTLPKNHQHIDQVIHQQQPPSPINPTTPNPVTTTPNALPANPEDKMFNS